MVQHKEQKRIVAIGKIICAKRKEQGITQEQLAFEAEMPRVQIGRIERGEINTSIGSLLIICDTLAIQPKELFE